MNTNRQYQLTAEGVDLGTYEAPSARVAVEQYAQRVGFESYARMSEELCSRFGDTITISVVA